MYFNEAEVVELGSAEELIQEIISPENLEGTSPSRTFALLAVYIADAE